MIILLLFFYFFSGHTTNAGSIDFTKSKPIMCPYKGQKLSSARPNTPIPDPTTIPKECDVIVFVDCGSSGPSNYSCNTDTLKKLLELKKPVIMEVPRFYHEWVENLCPDGNAADAKFITDYITSNGGTGVMLSGISPEETNFKPNVTLKDNMIPYLKQLKISPDFYVGILKDFAFVPDSTDFDYEASNDFMDFYVINTYLMNIYCNFDLYNGETPIHHTKELMGLDTAVCWIKDRAINPSKVYMVIDLLAVDPTDPKTYVVFSSYDEVCSGNFDTCPWCIPTTKDYYDKAKFIHDLNYGVMVYWIELDDFQKKCECEPYIGLLNIVAGYKGEAPKPCPKFDVKATP